MRPWGDKTAPSRQSTSASLPYPAPLPRPPTRRRPRTGPAKSPGPAGSTAVEDRALPGINLEPSFQDGRTSGPDPSQDSARAALIAIVNIHARRLLFSAVIVFTGDQPMRLSVPLPLAAIALAFTVLPPISAK